MPLPAHNSTHKSQLDARDEHDVPEPPPPLEARALAAEDDDERDDGRAAVVRGAAESSATTSIAAAATRFGVKRPWGLAILLVMCFAMSLCVYVVSV